MLCNGFTASERTGDSRNTALCYREKCIDNSLSRDKRHIGRKFFLVRSASSYGPFLHKFKRNGCAVFGFDCTDFFLNCVVALFYGLNFALNAERNHYFMSYNICFLNISDLVACTNLVACRNSREEMPFNISWKRRNLDTSCKAVACNFHYLFKRSLNTVEYTFNKSRSQFNAQGLVG